MRRGTTLLVLVALLMGFSSAAAAQKTIEEHGAEIVGAYCADCHAIANADESKHPTAPPFRELHERYEVDFLAEALVEGLVTHPDMPEFEFDPIQAEAIISYIKSLSQKANPNRSADDE